MVEEVGPVGEDALGREQLRGGGHPGAQPAQRRRGVGVAVGGEQRRADLYPAAPLRPERRDRRARRAALARELRVPLADLVELLAQRALAVLVLRDADSNI